MKKWIIVIAILIAIVALNGCNDGANPVAVVPTIVAPETATLAVTTPIPTRTQASRIPAATQPPSNTAVQSATPKPVQISVTPAMPSTPTATRHVIPPEKPKLPTPTAFIIPSNAYSRTITATVMRRTQPGQLGAIWFVDAAHGWLAADNVLLATSDGGTLWQPRYTAPYPIFALDFVSLTHGWMQISNVKANRRELYATNDGGSSWRQITIDGMPGLSSVQFADEQHGGRYASITGPSPKAFNITDTRLKRTQDGGKTWTNNVLDDLKPAAVQFTDPMHGWLYDLDGHRYVTADGGHSWQQVE